MKSLAYMSNLSAPLPYSYWVIPGKLLAGKYPAVKFFEDQTRRNLSTLFTAGIRVFVDLTRPGELPPYHPLLQEEADALGLSVQYFNHSIEDFEIPSRTQMIKTLDLMDHYLAENKPVYLHCWAGQGRTGTTVGCYLVRHGYSGQQALEQIARLRQNLPNAAALSPESDPQRRMVLDWNENLASIA